MTKRLSLVASFVLILAVPAMAQRSTATIRGVVSDPTNAVVSGAKVSIKNEDTGLSRSGEARVLVLDGDLGPRDHGIGGIAHHAADRGRGTLGHGRDGQDKDKGRDQ